MSMKESSRSILSTVLFSFFAMLVFTCQSAQPLAAWQTDAIENEKKVDKDQEKTKTS